MWNATNDYVLERGIPASESEKDSEFDNLRDLLIRVQEENNVLRRENAEIHKLFTFTKTRSEQLEKKLTEVAERIQDEKERYQTLYLKYTSLTHQIDLTNNGMMDYVTLKTANNQYKEDSEKISKTLLELKSVIENLRERLSKSHEQTAVVEMMAKDREDSLRSTIKKLRTNLDCITRERNRDIIYKNRVDRLQKDLKEVTAVKDDIKKQLEGQVQYKNSAEINFFKFMEELTENKESILLSKNLTENTLREYLHRQHHKGHSRSNGTILKTRAHESRLKKNICNIQPATAPLERTDIDESALRRDILVETLWSEIARRKTFGQSVELPGKKVSMDSELKFFLRDQFPEVRMSAVISVLNGHDFYSAMLIFKLATLDEHEKLIRQSFVSSRIMPILLPSDQIDARRAEASDIKAPVPNNVSKYWTKYLEIVNKDYLKPFRIDCPVCFEELMETQCVECTPLPGDNAMDHRFCRTCIKQHAVASLGNAVAFAGSGFICLESGCNGIILWSRVEPLLSDSEKRCLSNLIDEKAVAAAAMEDVERCVACPYACVIDSSAETQPIFICPKCSNKHCRLCRRIYDKRHINRKCDEYDFDQDQARIRLEEELTDIKFRKCECGVSIEKTRGCNFITCTMCNRTMCYVCRTRNISKMHFARGQCKLNDDEIKRRDMQMMNEALSTAAKDQLVPEDVVRALR